MIFWIIKSILPLEGKETEQAGSKISILFVAIIIFIVLLVQIHLAKNKNYFIINIF